MDDIGSVSMDYPPAPPRRISSKNSQTLKLVTSTRSTSASPMRSRQEQSNVTFLKDKISHKLNRQNTHVIVRKEPSSNAATINNIPSKIRPMSTSAPPALNRKKITISSSAHTPTRNTHNDVRSIGTSSFGSPRKTLLPTEYTNISRNKYSEAKGSVIIEGGAGRRTPISNILDKVTSLDKLWSAQKRNEPIEISKLRPKTNTKSGNIPSSKLSTNRHLVTPHIKISPPSSTHKSRDMIRTSEKVQKNKTSNVHTKCIPNSNDKIDSKTSKYNSLQKMSNISKSSSNIPQSSKKHSQIKTAIVTNLKKKKSLENIPMRPRSVPCHEVCSKKAKDANKNIKKTTKLKPIKKSDTKSSEDFEINSQFGDTLTETLNVNSCENLNLHRINSKELKDARDSLISDSFFQHLFLRNAHLPTINLEAEQNIPTTVLQKAKFFQTYPQNYSSSTNSINTYLIHRKPVTLSRFKMWDRYPSPARTSSPRSISWPGRMDGKVRKFDSLLKCYDEFGSVTSLSTNRSRSEPPTNKIYFSQTTRPKSPTVILHKKNSLQRSPSRTSISPSRLVYLQPTRDTSPDVLYNIPLPHLSKRSPSPTKLIFTETVRPISPTVVKRITKISKGVEDNLKVENKNPATIFFSQTSRPVSPKVLRQKKMGTSRSQSTSPVSIRSPSYRRIHNVRTQGKFHEDTIKKRTLRPRSVDNNTTKTFANVLPRSHSYSHGNDPEYDEYINDIQNTKVRSERFRELNRYYNYLERVAELEKATSNSDLRIRKKDEEIIDFDRWKKIRAIERAEDELNSLYSKLKIAQSENDILFYPKDLKDFRWNYDKERGLRVKEKSVEDLKEEFQQKPYIENPATEHCKSRDTYTPLWRGTSVAETAFNINRKNKSDNEIRVAIKPTISLQQDASLVELRKKIGFGNRLWSSLSMDQVNALKNQLNAIYSKELESKSQKEIDKYTIDVKDTKEIEKPSLHVRCNSLITTQPTQKKELGKSESIAAISCPITSVKELKNNVNKMQMALSENEKKKISQTLSKEVLNRMNKLDTLSFSLKQEIISKDDDNKSESTSLLSKNTNDSNVTKVKEECESKRHVVYPTEKTESSASETETGSSDFSNKTVIYKGPTKEVQKKVEYFESVRSVTIPKQSKIFHQVKEISNENLSMPTSISEDVKGTTKDNDSQNNQIYQSQSCTNIKELFGESEKNKYLSLPIKPDLYTRSPSPHSEVYLSDRRTPDTLRYSSDETIWRSRSPSPDPERYWRAYLKLAREGEVRRLARRFDSPSAAGAVLRRHRSDPEIVRNVINNNWPRLASSRRERCRAILPVARVPLKPTNRFMPHIDVISKLAALRKRTAPRSRSAEEAFECRPGEVERIRRRFEAMTLLGPVYTSAPDVSELQDIAPYLAGSWIAHRYPKPSDNYISVKDASCLSKERKDKAPAGKAETKRAVTKEPVKLSSILKNETLAKQAFDPSVHRPVSRYEPPRAPPRPPPAAWPYRLAPIVTPSRHTVTFQETDFAPEPPRRLSYGSYSDTESPSRRYVESDVNIHYRCPVRHDPLPLVPERELARQQAEHMKRLYREQKRNKYLQELQDMQNRRHQDNFMPSQKTVVPLNRYDEPDRSVARALYAFNGQTSRELSFRKGDLINVRRQIDSNWYEGEVHGRIGLFPYNYVELLKGDVAQTPKKPAVVEGRARAKFDFTAQTNLELPLKKGEVVVLTRRIDQNWWEGRNGNKTGIFPDSYVTVLQEPSLGKLESQSNSNTDKPVASPAAHGLLNGTAKRSMGSHSYTPQQNSPALANAPPATQPLPGYATKQPQNLLTPSERGYGPPTGAGVDLNNAEPLYVDTNAEAVPYRAMYKYRPQNPDELELNEGDTVYVLEKCDDGWYVGSSQRTGRFGTFPGNYVERI
ncbi:uncharacterized protein CAP isoform X9 [Epargyreus clarus]|uniref:uncharacterized protein CAP isoform X9 n=1 Tax=Epargyreus clarus TaxID=520877 RepID=UPI003C2CE8CF